MKRLPSTILIFGLCGLLSCSRQQDNGQTFNKTYKVGSIPDNKDFQTYNQDEKRLDSFENRYDYEMDSLFRADTSQRMSEIFRKKDFRSNRSRIYMDLYTNGVLHRQKGTTEDKSFATPCDCIINKDTLQISMGIGFFGGGGFNLKVFRDNFEANYFEYTDDVKPYKLDLNDTSYYNNVIAKSKYQFLILNNKPTFKSEQQITGYLTFTSNNYYEQQGNKLDTTSVTSKLYFTCNTRKK